MQKIDWDKDENFKEVSEEEINHLENHFSINFPNDYREFIKNHSGCDPLDKDVVDIGDFRETLNGLFDIRDDDETISLLEMYIGSKDRLIDNVIPFADDPAGNLFCFDYRRSSTDPVIVFWDHEEAFENPENALTYICDSFTDLINSLREYDEDEDE
ncbi:SMI1/KNR4 family protein [Bacillus sp. CLL-7-23]|uniref:SMI1/KNR4 family protein n=1 Tax=Bacillus changyiensis TaxID=3004103 RepID=A0ABT4X8U6_9BACI|nr:SMI1/KNR4 family protein [Bacillus changyiensis]MDA7028615.1 SMI1/KNR4 family protein [Bacillus changyiensis]